LVTLLRVYEKRQNEKFTLPASTIIEMVQDARRRTLDLVAEKNIEDWLLII